MVKDIMRKKKSGELATLLRIQNEKATGLLCKKIAMCRKGEGMRKRAMQILNAYLNSYGQFRSDKGGGERELRGIQLVAERKIYGDTA